MRIKKLLGPYVILDPHRERDEKHGKIVIPERYRAIVANDEETMVRKSNMWTMGTVKQVGLGDRKRTSREGLPMQGRVPIDLEVDSVVFYRRADASPMPDDSGFVIINIESVGGTVDHGEG